MLATPHATEKEIILNRYFTSICNEKLKSDHAKSGPPTERADENEMEEKIKGNIMGKHKERPIQYSYKWS